MSAQGSMAVRYNGSLSDHLARSDAGPGALARN